MYERFVKRVLDLILSIIGIVILLPVWIIVPILIKKDDGGPVFYLAPRIGKNSVKILMYKFRSMKVGNEDIRNADGSTYNSVDDPRVTKIGRFLRRTSMDELPQLFNIFAGQMAIVGPRPALYNQIFLLELRSKNGSNALRPGLTGWAQINGRDEISDELKAQYDGEYAKRISFSFDCRCFLATIGKVFKREGIVEGCK